MKVLNLLLVFLEIVLGNLRSLLRLLERVERVVTALADGNLGLLGHARGYLGEFLAALAGEFRNVDADDRALNRGIETDVGGLNRLLDVLERIAVPRLNLDRTGVRGSDCGNVAHLGIRAVAVDEDHERIDHAGRSFAGVEGGKIVVEVLQRLLHLIFGFKNDFVGFHMRMRLSVDTEVVRMKLNEDSGQSQGSSRS